MLSIKEIDVYYKELQAIWGVSMAVNEGELVALVGPNGAGKTTILRVISGLLKSTSGNLEFLGKSLKNLPPHRIVEMGISQVPESGKIFTGMTVFENLELGAFLSAARKVRFQTLKWVYEIFPRLEERKDQMAGTLSGGERQMLAIGRALMSKPKLLLLDEPSFGLAPIMVENMFEMIARINKQGVTILLVEQNIQAALELAHRAYLLENGKIVGGGKASELLSFESVRSAYLGDDMKGGKDA
jgi:branched-chain amino acid transport system ATP-binding protein